MSTTTTTPTTITNTGSGLASSFKIFGVVFNIKLTLYVLGSIAFGVCGIMYFNSSKQYIGMMVFLPLTLLVLIVYGNRWFGPNGSATTNLTKWPPQINTCPDFLTSYTNYGKQGCVDMIGVSTKGFQQVSDPTTLTTQDNNDNSVKFFPLNVGETRQSLCARLQRVGLTWEGVYDGVSCLAPNGSGTSLVPGSGCSTTG